MGLKSQPRELEFDRALVLGVLLTPIVLREQTTLKALQGKSFAVDGNIELHQFLAIIRKPDGTLFTDANGRVTSHLIGLFTRTTRLITEYGMKLVFVFDGKPNPLKKRTVEARRMVRQRAEKEYGEAISRGDYSKAWSKAVMTGRVTGDILGDATKLLTLMGVPWFEALEDAEAQASHMASNGLVWGVGSKDYDSLLYGAPILARYLTLTGHEYLPAQQKVRPLVPELVSLQQNLQGLGITRGQLVDVAILVGTDFNDGIYGVGPKKALALIRRYGSIDSLPREVRTQVPSNLEEIRQLFLKPRVRDISEVKQTASDPSGLVQFLSEERGFSEERVVKVATRLSDFYKYHDKGLTEWLL